MRGGRGAGYGGAAGKGRGRGAPGGPVPKVGAQPSTGAGAAAVAKLAGPWEGHQGETYDVHPKDWACVKTDTAGSSRRYQLSWSSATDAILWGDRFCLPASDLAPGGPAKWFRCDDAQRSRCAFTWRRPMGFEAPGGRAAATGAPPTVRRVAPAATAAARAPPAATPVAEPPRAPSAARRSSSRPSAAEVAEAPFRALAERSGPPTRAQSVGAAHRAAAATDGGAELELAPEALAGLRPAVVAGCVDGGDGEELLRRLVGAWWGPRGKLYRVSPVGACEMVDVASNRAWKLHLGWDAQLGCAVWGEAFSLFAADFRPGDREARWRWRGGDAGGPPALVWARDDEEGEQ